MILHMLVKLLNTFSSNWSTILFKLEPQHLILFPTIEHFLWWLAKTILFSVGWAELFSTMLCSMSTTTSLPRSRSAALTSASFVIRWISMYKEITRYTYVLGFVTKTFKNLRLTLHLSSVSDCDLKISLIRIQPYKNHNPDPAFIKITIRIQLSEKSGSRSRYFKNYNIDPEAQKITIQNLDLDHKHGRKKHMEKSR